MQIIKGALAKSDDFIKYHTAGISVRRAWFC